MSSSDPGNGGRERSAADICPRAPQPVVSPTHPHSTPIYLTSVWSCQSPQQVDQLLGGELEGYVYQRDGHPNADQLAETCRQLHGAEEVCVVSSGMAALAVALLSQCQSGDRIAISNQLYGRSSILLHDEAARLGIQSEIFDPLDEEQTSAVLSRDVALVVVETIANPMLRLVDLRQLSTRCRTAGALLLVDNTFATPALCRPLEFGADLVMESVSKAMNGHSDVMLGMLAGHRSVWERVPQVVSTWGFAAAPLDCWLAHRGLTTLALRIARACQNALHVALWLQDHPDVADVEFPGLPEHPDHQLARKQLSDGFGSMVTFHLDSAIDVASFISGLPIPFCPSLGEVSTTISHPASTSHRGLSEEERNRLGISASTIRLSVGIESAATIVDWLQSGLS